MAFPRSLAAPPPPRDPQALARLAAADPRLCRLVELEKRRPPKPTFATGWDTLDAALGGGFPLGELSECSAPPTSCGLSTLQHQLLLAARRRQLLVAWVDPFDCFDPGSSDPPLLESLLWLRPQTVAQAMKATDILLRDDNFGLILLDLREATAQDLRRIPAQHWYRFQHAARENETTLLAFTPFPVAVSASRRLRFSGWERPAPAKPLDDVPRSAFAATLAEQVAAAPETSRRQIG